MSKYIMKPNRISVTGPTSLKMQENACVFRLILQKTNFLECNGMKKSIVTIIIVASIIIFASQSFAESIDLSPNDNYYSQGNFTLKINGIVMSEAIPVLIMNNRAYVPARSLFEGFGATVSWDDVNKRVQAVMENINISVGINDSKAIVNGLEKFMDTPARIIENTAFVPLRFVSEQLNMNVGWYPEEKVITLSSCKMTGLGNSIISSSEKIDIRIQVEGCNTYKSFYLKEPDRLVVDLPNTVLIRDMAEIKINTYPVKSIRYAQFDKKTTRVVFDVEGQPDYRITRENGQMIVTFSTGGSLPGDQKPTPVPDSTPAPDYNEPAPSPTPAPEVAGPVPTPATEEPSPTPEPEVVAPSPTPKPEPEFVEPSPTPAQETEKVEPSPTPTPEPLKESASTYERGENRVLLTLTNIKLVNEDGSKQYEELRDSSGNTIILKIPDNLANIQSKIFEIKDPLIENIIIFRNENTGDYFIVINARRRTLLNVTYNKEIDSSLIELYETSQPSRGDSGETRPPVVQNEIKNITYSAMGDRDAISIEVPVYENYNVFRLTDPDRIVIDIQGARISSSQQLVNVNSNLIKGVRYAQYMENVVRVVIDLKLQAWYEVSQKEGMVTVEVSNPQFKGVQYHNVYDRVYLTIPGIRLTGGYEEEICYYKGSYDFTGKVYTITFATGATNLGSGKMPVNDGMLESIEILQDPAKGETSIRFNAKSGYVYNISGRAETNDTAITIISPGTPDEKIIVIDAGHGGVDPGAVVGSIYEKNFNLDIALRLNRLLESKNIKTYMIRENDVFVGLYERAYIANKLNATLFLSIHNNALPNNKNYGGTETFYFENGSAVGNINGEVFAGLVQRKLVQYLNTADRLIKPKNYVVIKATSMPAVLAEVAFLTNEKDLSNLLDDDFRQRAAEALCEAILEALNSI